MMKLADYFEVAGYKVRFFQDAPVTVCVIWSFPDCHQKYTGVSVCHPDDTWDDAIGRHNALKAALIDGSEKLPIEEIKLAYAWYYKETWKMGKLVERKIESK